MTARVKIEVTGLSKAFRVRKKTKTKGIATDWVGTLAFLARQTMSADSYDVDVGREDGKFLLALDDVSFDVPAGEVLGIIGRNGAGKSTLLKIVARVLEPTAGRVVIRGRVASLLELGIGSAPDLSVADNIQIFGRLAGIPGGEIRAAEERILEFSRLAPFREVALGKCPSGSSVQLSFASMIGFNADIILADEVLTVGDKHFRQACEERIRAVGQSGESILFVSHDMNAIRRCCTRVIWLDKGRIRQVGPTDEIVQAYTDELLKGHLQPASPSTGPGCRILDLRLLDAESEQIGALQITEPSYIDCLFRLDQPQAGVSVELELWQGKRLVLSSTCPNPISARRPTTFSARMRLPADFLNDTPYRVICRLLWRGGPESPDPVVLSKESLDFSVMNPRPQQSVWTNWRWGRRGAISPRLQWNIEYERLTAVSPSE